jgi:hypothetical protein
MLNRHLRGAGSLAGILTLSAAAATGAAASSLTMIYQASDFPSATQLLPPVPVAYGQVIGGTQTQGQDNGQNTGVGTLFVLTPGKKGSWVKTVLHTFTNETRATDGANPSLALVADKHGNVWGTTGGFGINNTGTVFELVKPAAKGGSWTYRYVAPLPVFQTSYGGSVALVFDKHGNLFGSSTTGCSQNDCGSLFEVTAATLAGGAAPAKVLINFPTSLDGTTPQGLTIDPSGNLYGTSQGGGGNGPPPYYDGTVWEISPGAKGKPYSFQFLHAFCSVVDTYNQCVDGNQPFAGVTYANGVLYGTTGFGGAGYVVINPDTGQGFTYGGNGEIFSLTPPATPGAPWTFTTLHELVDYIGYNMPGPDYDVHTPQAAPVISSTGALMLPTALGGVLGGLGNFIYGSVISVDPSSDAEAIVNDDFGVENGMPRTGPLNDINNPRPVNIDSKNRVFGTSTSNFDTGCDCYHYWGDIWMVTP